MKINYLIIGFSPLFLFTWVLGIDQLLVVPFTLFCILIYQLKYSKFPGLYFDKVSICFLIVFISSFFSLNQVSNYGLWIKLTFTFLFALLYYCSLLSFASKLSSRYIADSISKAMFILSVLICLFTIIFLIYPSLKFQTIFSPLFPSGSHFFESMRVHSLSSIDIDYESLNSVRYSGIFISYSSMSMASILLMGIVGAYNCVSRGVRFTVVTGLFLASLLTQSRLGIISALLVYTVFIYALFFRKYLLKIGPRYTVLLVSFFTILLAFVFHEPILKIYNDIIFGMRSNSAHTRMRIYEATLTGIAELPIFGWGHSNPIDFSSQRFSAGTHSSYLSIAYQRGIPAAFFYFSMMLALLLLSFRNMWNSNNIRLLILSSAFIGFFIREGLDTWWWDSLLFFVVINFFVLFKLENEVK